MTDSRSSIGTLVTDVLSELSDMDGVPLESVEDDSKDGFYERVVLNLVKRLTWQDASEIAHLAHSYIQEYQKLPIGFLIREHISLRPWSFVDAVKYRYDAPRQARLFAVEHCIQERIVEDCSLPLHPEQSPEGY